MSRTETDRLECWVQIADYLKCNVRTARRWENRGLPVRRVPGGEHSAVFAYRNEIDAWMAGTMGQTPGIDALSQENGGSRPSQEIQLAKTATTAPRHNFKTVAGAVLVFIFAAALTLSLLRIRRSGAASLTTRSDDSIEIASVSNVLPQRDQTIVIRGTGFGLHTPYRNADSSYLAIRDKTAGWAAGRIIPQNWDEVTLDVESWDDAQIIVSGLSGAYGSGDWKLNPGNKIEVAVWNPQSGHGPALYHLTVSARPTK